MNKKNIFEFTFLAIMFVIATTALIFAYVEHVNISNLKQNIYTSGRYIDIKNSQVNGRLIDLRIN